MMQVVSGLRYWIGFVLLLAGSAQAAEISREYQIKSAMLFNFTKFAQWPESSFEQDPDIRLCIVPPNPFDMFIDELVEGQRIGKAQRRIRVIHLTDNEERLDCHVMFFPEAAQVPVMPQEAYALLVTEHVSSEQQGAHIRFYQRGDRVRFEASMDNLSDVPFRLSSQLLKLSRSQEAP